jgi:ABC-type molybdate transport system substrate-binding protein
MMNVRRFSAGLVFLAAAVVAGGAGAAELKVLSVDAMKPALQQLAPAFKAASKNTLKIEYATAADIEKKIVGEEDYDIVIVDQAITKKLGGAAKVAAGSIKPVAKKGADQVYDVSTPNWTQKPLEAKALIDFLTTKKAEAVYKAKGLQPG